MKKLLSFLLLSAISLTIFASCRPSMMQVSPSCNNRPIGSLTILTCSSTGVTYLWSTGETTQTINGLVPGTYSCVVNDPGTSSFFPNPDTVVGTVNNGYQSPTPICLITVDQNSTYNTVVWDRGTIPAIDSFCIYRETATNVYSKIATVPPDSLSTYNDHAANPNVTSYTYVITVKDTCGNESVYSNSHTTIHLQSNGNGNFAWTLYQIQNTPNPVNYYIIYRDSLGTGNFTPLSSTIPGTNTTYTDVNSASFPNALYYVEALWNISCTPTRSINTTRSNTKSLIATGIEELTASNLITIIPNPNSGIFRVETKNINMSTIKIHNTLGEIIYESQNINSEIDLSAEPKGTYFIEVYTQDKIYRKKLIIQ